MVCKRYYFYIFIVKDIPMIQFSIRLLLFTINIIYGFYAMKRGELYMADTSQLNNPIEDRQNIMKIGSILNENPNPNVNSNINVNSNTNINPSSNVNSNPNINSTSNVNPNNSILSGESSNSGNTGFYASSAMTENQQFIKDSRDALSELQRLNSNTNRATTRYSEIVPKMSTEGQYHLERVMKKLGRYYVKGEVLLKDGTFKEIYVNSKYKDTPNMLRLKENHEIKAGVHLYRTIDNYLIRREN